MKNMNISVPISKLLSAFVLLGFVSSNVVASISRETAQTASVGDVVEDIEYDELNLQIPDLSEAGVESIRISILLRQAKLALIKGESWVR
jgi:YbbR domain-containing protein